MRRIIASAIALAMIGLFWALFYTGLEPDVAAVFNASTDVERWTQRWGETKDVRVAAPEELLPVQLPGPADTWAGATDHTLEIEFEIEPGKYKVKLQFFEIHDTQPSTFVIDINGEKTADLALDAGSGKAPPYRIIQSALSQDFVFATDHTKNAMRIRNVAGSWAAIARIQLVKGVRFNPALACHRVAGAIGFLQPYETLCDRFQPENAFAKDAPVYRVSNIPPGGPNFLAWARWSGGNWDLYLRDETHAIRRLTETPWDEYFPRISPDGVWLYFVRIKPDSKSVRRINIETGKEDDWSIEGSEYMSFAGGNTLYYDVYKDNEKRSVIERLDLATGERTRVPVSDLKPYAKMSLTQPAPAMDGKVMFVLVNRWGWRIERAPGVGAEMADVGTGCRPAASPDGKQVVFIHNRGNGGTSVMIHDVATGNNRTVVDMPGPISHEYDARFSNDGRWLVFTAAPNDNWVAQRGANYAIYGCPADDCKPVVLLDMPGADAFPDLYFKKP